MDFPRKNITRSKSYVFFHYRCICRHEKMIIGYINLFIVTINIMKNRFRFCFHQSLTCIVSWNDKHNTHTNYTEHWIGMAETLFFFSKIRQINTRVTCITHYSNKIENHKNNVKSLVVWKFLYLTQTYGGYENHNSIKVHNIVTTHSMSFRFLCNNHMPAICLFLYLWWDDLTIF